MAATLAFLQILKSLFMLLILERLGHPRACSWIQVDKKLGGLHHISKLYIIIILHTLQCCSISAKEKLGVRLLLVFWRQELRYWFRTFYLKLITGCIFHPDQISSNNTGFD